MGLEFVTGDNDHATSDTFHRGMFSYRLRRSSNQYNLEYGDALSIRRATTSSAGTGRRTGARGLQNRKLIGSSRKLALARRGVTTAAV